MKQFILSNLFLVLFMASFTQTSAQCNWKARQIEVRHLDSCKGIDYTSNTITAYVLQSGSYLTDYSAEWTVNGAFYSNNLPVIAYNFSNSGFYKFCVKLTDSLNNCDTTYCIDVYINCKSCPNWKNEINYEYAYGSDSCPSRYFYAAVGMKDPQAYTYQWTSNATTITTNDSFGHYVPDSNGLFNVCIRITDTLTKCDTMICHHIYYNCHTTGIADGILKHMDIKVHPNPAAAKLNFESRNPGSTYKICDSWGRVLLSGMSITGLNTVDISGLPSGVFYLSLADVDRIYRSVFVHQIE